MSMIFIVSDFVTARRRAREPGARAARAQARRDRRRPEDPRGDASCRPAAATCTCAMSSRAGASRSGSAAGARARYAAAARQRREALARAFYRVPMDHVFVPTDRQSRAAGAVAVCQETSVIKRGQPPFFAQTRGQPGAWDGCPDCSQTNAAVRFDRAGAPAVFAQPAQAPVVHASVDRTADLGRRTASTYAIDIVCAPGVDILSDDLAKEKLRLNGLDVVGSDRRRRPTPTNDDAPTALRADDLSRRSRRRSRSSRCPRAITSGARASGCRTSPRPARSRSLPLAIAFRSTLARTSRHCRAARRRRPRPRHPVFARPRDRPGACGGLARAGWRSSRRRAGAAADAGSQAGAPPRRRGRTSGRRSSGCGARRVHDRGATAGPTTRSARRPRSTSRRARRRAGAEPDAPREVRRARSRARNAASRARRSPRCCPTATTRATGRRTRCRRRRPAATAIDRRAGARRRLGDAVPRIRDTAGGSRRRSRCRAAQVARALAVRRVHRRSVLGASFRYRASVFGACPSRRWRCRRRRSPAWR